MRDDASTTISPVPHMSPEEFRALAGTLASWITDYWQRVESLPVLSRAAPGDVLRSLPEHPPMQGQSLADALPADLERMLPAITHWQHPMFFAYFPANISAPAVLGELLSAGLGVQGMLWTTSPACTELEMRVLDWLGEMIGLPEAFLFRGGTGGGVIQGTASEAVLAVMASARTLARASARASLRGAGAPRPDLVAYASTQAHSSIQKAAMIAGIADGPDDHEHVRLIETDTAYAMKPESLRAAIRGDVARGRTPFFVCASVGTTGSTAVDSIEGIARVLAEERAELGVSPWLHVDGAHAGASWVCPEMRWMLRGIEHADSVCFNPHKWLLTNFDCDCLWVRERARLIDAMSITPEYLRNQASATGEVVDYRDWHIPLGRRFRALKLWFVIRHYGVEGLRAYIREHLRLAHLFESLVAQDSRFEIVTPRTMNLVCFRPRPRPGEAPEQIDTRTRGLMERLNASGRLYLTHTVLPGVDGSPARLVLRMAIGAVQTREHHVRLAWDLIREALGD